MEMTVTNGKKSINLSLPDDITENIDDVRFIIGTEQYKLVSAKSDEDKAREKAAVEFGEIVYEKLYKDYPDFGTEECKTTREEMFEIIKSELEERREQFTVLVNDKNIVQLVNSLVTAYSNYCTVRKRMESEEKTIKESQLDENVFFDYIKRFKAAIEKATCIKDVHEAIVKLHHFAGIDRRELYGYTYIFNCLAPLFDKINEIEKELKEMKPVVKLHDHVLFTDTEFWKEAEQITIVNKVIENLNKLEETYRNWEKASATPENVYKFYVDNFIAQYRNVVEARDAINKYTSELRSKDGKIENLSEEQTNKVDELVDKCNKCYRGMLAVLADLRIKYNLDINKFKPSDATIINANFGLIDFWNNEMSTAHEAQKFITMNKMANQLHMHASVLAKTLTGDIKTEDLVTGKYTTEDLIKIAHEPSKQ